MAMVSLVAATILLSVVIALLVVIAAALQTRKAWKTEKIDQFIEIGPLF